MLEPPVAKRVAHTWDRPTGPVDDPWAWLADPDDPDTLAYLEAENAYADAWLGEHAPLVDAIFDEIKARTQENDETVPARKGPWWYASRTVEGLAYPIHCRGGTAATATEVVLLDENEEAGTGFFELGAFDVSPGHGLLAWSADRNGHEVFEMRIRDLAAGTDLPDRLEGTYYGTAWSADERYLFYTRPDHAMRPYQVWRHEVGTAQGDDVLVYEEPDEHYNVDLELCRSGAYVIITNEANTSTDVLVLPAAQPLAEPQLVAERRPDVEYRLDHWGDRFVILTNLDAPDFKVVSAPCDSPAPPSGSTSCPTRPGAASRRSSRSSTTSCCTSGPTRSSASASSAATAPSGRWPSTTRSTPSPSAPTPSTTRRRSASPTSPW